MQSTVFLMQAGGQSGGPEQRKDIHSHSISLPLSGEPIIVALSMNTENKFPHGGPMKAIASSCLPLLFRNGEYTNISLGSKTLTFLFVFSCLSAWSLVVLHVME